MATLKHLGSKNADYGAAEQYLLFEHECSYDENKTRRQDIEIYYSFVGKVDLPE